MRASTCVRPRASRRRSFSSKAASGGSSRAASGAGEAAAAAVPRSARRCGFCAGRFGRASAGASLPRVGSGLTVRRSLSQSSRSSARQPAHHAASAGAGSSAIIVAEWLTRPAPRRPPNRSRRKCHRAPARNRGTGVLGNHQAPKLSALALRISQLWRFDKDRRVEGMERAIDGEASIRQKRHAGGAERAVVLRDRRLTEENVGAVLAHERESLFGVALQPGLQPILVRLAAGKNATLDRQPADGGVGVPGLSIEGDSHRAAIGKVQPRRSLHMDEEGLDRTLQVGKLQAAAGKGALLDLCAIEEGHETIIRAARETHFRVPAWGTILVANLDQVTGPAEERHRKTLSRDAARLDHGLVIAGDEPSPIDPVRKERSLEERAAAIGQAGLVPANASRATRCRPRPLTPSARVFGGVSAISRAPAVNAANAAA